MAPPRKPAPAAEPAVARRPKLQRQLTRSVTSTVSSTVGNVTSLSMRMVGKLMVLKSKASDTGAMLTPARVIPQRSKADEKAARKIFAEADKNGDGQLTFQEMKEALRALATEMGTSISASEVFSAFESADEDSNSVVSVDEFCSFYSRWIKEQRGKPSKTAGERKSRLAPRSAMAPTIADADQERKERDAAGEASHKRALTLVKGVEPISYDEHWNGALSDLFVQASSGMMDGIHAQGTHHGFKLDAKKTIGEEEDEGRIDRIRMPLEKFRVFCSLIGIDGVALQANFFRNCRPGKDKLLTFQELLRGIAPLIKGNVHERNAFQFLLYDENGNGMIEPREVFRLQQDLRPDCPIETDLICFAKLANDLPHGAKSLTFDTYETHVAKNGECKFHDDLKKLLLSKERVHHYS